MKANELMIGDWVDFYHPYEPEKKIVTRHCVTEVFECGLIGISDHPNPVHADHIEPVNITPEILEKNGFVPKFSDGCLTEYLIYKDIIDGLHEMYIRIAYFNTKEKEHKLECFYCRTGGCQIWIKYVHQLQHALRLCGINKEIVL